MQTKTARFTKTVLSLAHKAVVAHPPPAHRPGKYSYADWVILAIQGLKEYLGHHFRKLMDVLQEMPRVAKLRGLTPETLPHFSTVCARKQEIPMIRWRAILEYSVDLYDLSDVQAIVATGMERIQGSQHYAKRTDYTFEAVKASLLINCETSTILDIPCSMKQPHESQGGWQVLTLNLDALCAVAADKGYDWEMLRLKTASGWCQAADPDESEGSNGSREEPPDRRSDESPPFER